MSSSRLPRARTSRAHYFYLTKQLKLCRHRVARACACGGRRGGWLGSGGEGMVVMDDLRVRQVNSTKLGQMNLNNPLYSLGNNSTCIQVSNMV